jgi:hypothetical protein
LSFQAGRKLIPLGQPRGQIVSTIVIPASHFAALVLAIVVLAAVIVVIAVIMLIVSMAVLVGQACTSEGYDHRRSQPQPAFAFHLVSP